MQLYAKKRKQYSVITKKNDFIKLKIMSKILGIPMTDILTYMMKSIDTDLFMKYIISDERAFEGVSTYKFRKYIDKNIGRCEDISDEKAFELGIKQYTENNKN